MVQIIKSNWWWGSWWGGGWEWDMKKSVYDPQNVGKNVYDYNYFINTPDIPTKTSDLTNDSGFITSSSLPTKTSDLTNDSWFITNNALSGYQTTANIKTNLTSPDNTHYPSTKAVSDALENKQWTLTAGTGIDITNNVISTPLTTFILNDPGEQKTELYNWCRSFWGGDKVPVIISWDGGACYYWSMWYSDRDVFFNGTNIIEIIYEFSGGEIVGIDKFVWYPIDAKFYINSDLSNIASVWQDVADWLNKTSQDPTTTSYIDATVFVWDMPYYRVWSVIADGSNYVVAFYEDGTRIQNASSQTRTYRSEIRFTFSYTDGVWAYVSEAHSYIQILTPYVLRTDYDYSTPYTPLYNWSPATKKYVDDNVSVVSGDSGVTYTIKVSNSDPASWTASNIITLVP